MRRLAILCGLCLMTCAAASGSNSQFTEYRLGRKRNIGDGPSSEPPAAESSSGALK